MALRVSQRGGQCSQPQLPAAVQGQTEGLGDCSRTGQAPGATPGSSLGFVRPKISSDGPPVATTAVMVLTGSGVGALP